MDSNPDIHVTVAAIIESGGRFLLVEEQIDGRIVLNQPAGHLDPGESLPAAAARETLEETGYTFEPSHLVGIYHWQNETRHDVRALRVLRQAHGSRPAPCASTSASLARIGSRARRCSRASAICGARW